MFAVSRIFERARWKDETRRYRAGIAGRLHGGPAILTEFTENTLLAGHRHQECLSCHRRTAGISGMLVRSRPVRFQIDNRVKPVFPNGFSESSFAPRITQNDRWYEAHLGSPAIR